MAEMADQLTGVLHEIVAAETDTAKPRMSNYFSPQRAVYGVGLDVPVDAADVIAALPVPVVDPNDPGASVLATTSGTPPAQLEQALPWPGVARTNAKVPPSRCRCDWSARRSSSAPLTDARNTACRAAFGDTRRLAAGVVRRTMCTAGG